jgi:hypothetical protein
MEHRCQKNDTLDRIGECRIVRVLDEKGWWMTVDDGCCQAEVNYCPFCGTKLD